MYTRTVWDNSKLLVPEAAKKYDELVAVNFEESWRVGLSFSEQWERFCQTACASTAALFKQKPFQRDSRIQDAYVAMQRQLQLVTRARQIDIDASYDPLSDSPPSLLPAALTSLAAARRAYKKLLHEARNKTFEELLTNMEKHTHIGDRLRMAFKYLKPIRRSIAGSPVQVNLRDWHRELQTVQGQSVKVIDEVDHWPLMKPPTRADMMEVLCRMKNGKSPGLDLISVEMLRASPTLADFLYDFIYDAYKTCAVPKAWQSTVSHPIPKKTIPKNISDYRKITLCSVGYKIFATLLLDLVKPFLPMIREYQSGFLPNRSCDDLVFVMKQVLDARWNHGQTTFILSIDFEKAFDLVDIHKLPSILVQHGVPHYLINTLITACLHEHNCVAWLGEKTTSVNKSRGIKQGCPVSPFLFNLILDWAVEQLKERLMQLGVELFTAEKEKPIALPMLLAYADDTSFLTESLPQLELIITEFIPILQQVGLRINAGKSGLIVKSRGEPDPPSLVSISGLVIPVLKTAKILGVSITSSVSRKDFVRERCNGSIRLTKSLLPSLKKMNMPIEGLMRLYHALICPSLIYGHKAGSMTEGNRRSLMNREIMILRDLVSIAHPKPGNISVFNLLGKKTINRKDSVYRIRYYGHISRRCSDTLLQKAKNFRIVSKRRVGRPRFTFNHTLLHDMRKFPNVTEEEWREALKQVNDLKRVTSTLYSRDDLADDPLNAELMLYSSDEED